MVFLGKKPILFRGFSIYLKVLVLRKEVLETANVRRRLFLLYPHPVKQTPMAEMILGALQSYNGTVLFVKVHGGTLQAGPARGSYFVEWYRMDKGTGRTCGLLWGSWHLGLAIVPQQCRPRHRLNCCLVTSLLTQVRNIGVPATF